MGASDVFVAQSLFGTAGVTRWSYLFEPLANHDGRFGPPFPSGPGSLYGYLRAAGASLAGYLAGRGTDPLSLGSPRKAQHAPVIEGLQRHAAQVAFLAGVPAPRLARLVAEHADLCSHRLDAWVLGLANRRLAEQRRRTREGVYLGAFGWVEDVLPDPPREAAVGVPAGLSEGPPIFEAQVGRAND